MSAAAWIAVYAEQAERLDALLASVDETMAALVTARAAARKAQAALERSLANVR